MAQGDAWKLGVGVWFPNYRMGEPSSIGSTLLSAVAAGATTFTGVWAITTGGGYLRHYFRRGDIITLGPSTHANNRGMTEEVVVNSASESDNSNLITVDSAIANDYAAGDPWHGIGSAIPSGWTGSLLSSGTAIQIATLGHNNGGVVDPYSLELVNLPPFGSYLYTHPKMGPPPDPLVKYFFSCHARYRGPFPVSTAGDSFELYFYAGYDSGDHGARGRLFIGSSQSANYTGTAWQEFSGTTGLSGDTYSPGEAIVGSHTCYFQVRTGNNNDQQYQIDCVVACHAEGTTDASSGICTLTEYPRVDSVRSSDRNADTHVMDLGQGMHMNSPGGAIKKHVINARFDHVSQATFDNLKVLLAWQRRGRFLLLKPSLDGVPPYLYGRLDVPNMPKNHWDLSRRSLDFQFTEA